MSLVTSRWRTAGFSLGLGVAAFVLGSAALGVVQGAPVFAPGACLVSELMPWRALPWLLVAAAPAIVERLVRFVASRRPLPAVTVGRGPYRQSVVGAESSLHPPRTHHVLRVLLAILAVGLGYTQSRRWSCPYAVPSTCHPATRRIALVPIGAIAPAVVEDLARHFHDCYGLPVVVGAPVEAPSSAWNAKRQQWGAEPLLDALPGCVTNPDRGSACDEQLSIGVTNLDVYATHEDWRFAFSMRDSARHVALVSTFRMTVLGAHSDRVSKMVAKNIALEYCGLPPTTDPHSVRFGGILGSDDLDRMNEASW